MKKIIKWLYDNYVGVRNYAIMVPNFDLSKPFVTYTKVYVSTANAARIMFPFFAIWAAYKLGQSLVTGAVYFSWFVDFPMLILLGVQYVAGFTQIVKKAHEKNIQK